MSTNIELHGIIFELKGLFLNIRQMKNREVHESL